ncbi:glycosyl hydrolase [Leptothrix cholodnii SP-6]|uniref:Glycosyl hydrolase n=1 Tax=Leptothrix cholodnii (strain ATCC 51168 / LMG 8142 / SP-6) TaxID=395495 RepID=B1Y2T8_LEPCP|nr:YCF48-related protein [Leptothrix cholodnii]ACB34430.1 glycosyl hydrolase [Leptothrix cholodnii SP-6]
MSSFHPHRVLLAIAAAGLLAGGVFAITAAAPAARDVLDSPAITSALASRGLLNGLAQAGERRIVAVGQRGHVLWSDDGGARWQQAQVPVSSDLVAVSFADARNGWAVGHDGVILHSNDGGASWSRQLDGRGLGALLSEAYGRADALPQLDAATRSTLLAEAERLSAQGAELPWLDVWFADAQNGYVVGAFGLILRTRDGGQHWEPLMHALDNPKALHLHALRGVGREFYIVGEQGLVLKLDRKNDGSTERFRRVELPYQGSLFGVIGNDRAVLVHGLRGSALRSTDGGASWQTVATGVQAGLTAATLAGDGRWLLASQAGHLLASTDDGASFSPVRLAGPLPAAALLSPAAGQIVIAGPRGVSAQPLP